MDLRSLACFVAVAEECSITRAAARLHMSQPPLTVRIKALEKQLGVALLVRHGRGVELTPAGRVLVERARRLLADVDGTAAAVRSIGQGVAGRLELAVGGNVAPGLLAALLGQIHADAPDVTLQVSDVTDAAVRDRVAHHEADAGLVHLPPRERGGETAQAARSGEQALETAVVVREPLVAILPAGDAAPGQERADLSQFTHRTVLAPARAGVPGLHDHVVAAWRAVGGSPERIVETHSTTTTLALVQAGVGIAVLPAAFAEVAWTGVAAVPLLQPHPPAETAIVWRRSATSPVLRRFLRLALATPEPDVLGPERARR